MDADDVIMLRKRRLPRLLRYPFVDNNDNDNIVFLQFTANTTGHAAKFCPRLAAAGFIADVDPG